MSAADNELLDAFLVEAGELLEGLDEQLIELENRPTDAALLNAVFRAWHTIKGGAGFLGAKPMVTLCHHAEDLLNEARNGRLTLSPEHVDALLQVLDRLQAMMTALAHGDALPEPPQALLQRLRHTAPASPAAATDDPVAQQAPPPAATVEATTTDPVNDAFDAMLDRAYDQMDGSGTGDSHSMTDHEFESLLDELHGSGKAPGEDPAPAAGDDSIDDSEFEALLDQLYGAGKAPGADSAPPPVSTASAEPPPPQQQSPQTPSPSASSPSPPPATSPPAVAADHPHAAETTVRVDTSRLDALVNAAGELVLVRNRLATLASQGVDTPMEQAIGELHRVAEQLQNAALRMRMQPIGRLFQRFPRIVRDLARTLGRDVTLIQEGEDTNLDRTLVEALADPLIHLLRNAVDHGLEAPGERERAGKPQRGTVRLSAGQEGERIVIRISDDGRGMDPDILRRKAVEKGLIGEEQAAQLEPHECYALIFAPGFSTREQISDISGRGVGMDVVKTRVAELGGTIGIDSQLGQGSTVRLSIPLTLAILRVLMVRVGCRLLALPLSNVKEVFELGPEQVRELDGSVVAAHRGKPLPLRDLGQWAGVDERADGNRHVVLLHIGHQRLGCVVHEVLGREEVMIKPLGERLQHVPGLAGATITGDGRIALVLDLVALTSGTALPTPLRATA